MRGERGGVVGDDTINERERMLVCFTETSKEFAASINTFEKFMLRIIIDAN